MENVGEKNSKFEQGGVVSCMFVFLVLEKQNWVKSFI